MGISIGSVTVDVVPDASNFNNLLRSQVLPGADATGRSIGETLARNIAEGIRQGLGNWPGEDTTRAPAARQGAAGGGAYADAFKAKVDEALRSLPPVQVGVATSEAEQKLRDLRAQLEELSTKRVGVDLDAETARAEIARIGDELRRLGADSADLQVRADTAVASAKLAELKSQLDGLQDTRFTVNADTSNASSGVSTLVAGVLALVPALVPVGGAATAALGSVAEGALVGTGALGVLKLAFSGVSDAVTAMSAEQAAAGQDALAAAQKHQAAADQIASAQRSVTSAEESLTNARASAAEGARASAEKITVAEEGVTSAEQAAAYSITAAHRAVGDAQTTLERTITSSSDAIARAEQGVESAEQSLADAQAASVRAQDALNEAREQAVRDLQDYSNKAVDARLSERQAEIDLAKARAANDATQKSSTATDLAKEQSALSLAQAQQHLLESQQQVTRSAQDNIEAQAAGVEGDKGVVTARDAVTAATQKVSAAQLGLTNAQGALVKAQSDGAYQVAQAQEKVATAQAALVKAQDDGAAKVAAAQRGVADAVAASAVQQRQSAASVESATNSLIGAQAALAKAHETTGSSASAAASKVQAAMAQLSPAGQEFAKFLFGLDDGLQRLQGVAQTAMFPGLQAGIEALAPLLPGVTQLVRDVAATIGDLGREAGIALGSPFWRSFIAFLDSIAGPVLRAMVTTVGDVATGLAALLMAMQPAIGQILPAIAGLAQRFMDFALQATHSAGFGKFLAYIVDNLPAVGALLMNLAGAALNIIVALAPLGPVILRIVDAALAFVAALPPRVLTDIIVAVAGLVLIFGKIVPILTPVVAWVQGLSIAFGAEGLTGVIAALGGPVTIVIGILAALGAALYVLWQNSTTARDIINAAFRDVAAVGTWLWKNALQPAFEGIGAAAVWLWKNVIVPTFDGIGTAISWAWTNVISPVVSALVWYWNHVLGPVFTWLWHNIVEPAFEGIRLGISVAWVAIQVILDAWRLYFAVVLGPVFTWLWRNVVEPVFSGIGGAITAAWNNVIRPVFDILGRYVRDDVAPVFQQGMTILSQAWNSLKDMARVPVDFVVNTVINNGIIDTFNSLLHHFPNVGISPIDHIHLPPGFAGGGYTGDGHKYQPAGIVHAGEYVFTQEETAAAGPSNLARLARSLRGYDGGGLVGDIGGAFSSAAHTAMGVIRTVGSDIATAAGDVASAVTDPAGTLKRLLSGLLGTIPGGGTDFGKLIAAVPSQLVDWASSAVTSALDALMGAGGGGSGFTWQILDGIRQRLFPGSVLTSAYRPGANDYHGRGQAIDIGVAGNTQAGLMPIAARLAQLYPGSTELIHNPNGSIKNGHPVDPSFWGADTWGQHLNHVHWAMTPAALGITGGFGGGGSFGSYSGVGAADPGGSVERWRGVVNTALGMLGQPLSLANGVLSLINSESGGNPNAVNLWDSNAKAGHPSRGLMQEIPATFEAYRSLGLADNIVDPLANVYAGVNYALRNYGAGMLAAGGRHGASGNYVGYDIGGLVGYDIGSLVTPPQLPAGLFDTGGWLDPGMHLVYNGTGQREMILNPPQIQQVLGAGAGSRTVNGMVVHGDVHMTDSAEAAHESYRQAAMALARFA